MDSDAPEGSTPPRRGRRLLRRIVSAWLAFHVAAILIAPASVDPASGLVQSGWLLVRPYVEFLYLNHGYHFFAPEPAESTLVAYAAEKPDGDVVIGRFPDPETAPRLLYHRYFMLSEHLAGAPDEWRDLWHRSLAARIAAEHGASKVYLSQVVHYLPTMEMGREGIGLDHPAGYVEQPLGAY